jgi:hypothetical protein
VPTDPDDDQDVTAPSPENTLPAEVIRAKAERLDRTEPTEVVGRDEEALRSEVAALRKQLRNQQRTTIIVVPLVVLLVVVVVVVMLASAPEALPTSAGNRSTASTTTTSSSSSSTSRAPSPAPTTTAETTAETTAADTTTVTVPPPTTTVPQAIPAPQVHLNGQDDIYRDAEFDFDSGSTYYTGDITHDGEAVSATNGALVAHGIPAADEYNRCATVPRADFQSHLRFSEFVDNPILCVFTDEGRLAFVELTGFPTSNGGSRMTFRWTTWRK